MITVPNHSMIHTLFSSCVVVAWVSAGFSTASAAEAAPTGSDNGNRFAMCSNGNMLGNPAYATAMLDAGARMVRLDCSFGTVRAKAGDDPAQWNWGELEKMRALRTAHPDLDILPILGYGAAWAEDPRFKDVAGGEPSRPPRGIEVMPATDPANLYGHFVFETVKRYKDVIHAWESWNEPDLPGHAFFKGDGRDFLPYQRACYLAAKAADPDCTVVFAGLCFASFEGYLGAHHLKAPTPNPPTACFLEEYLNACAKDPEAAKHHFYFDIMNQHSYSRASDLYDYVAVLRKLCRDTIKTDVRVWITEMGSPDQGGIFGCNADEYCDYVLQSFAWGSRSGVERFFHFQLDNSNGHGLYDGMLGKPKPALTAYRDVLVKEFADAHFLKQIHGTAGVGFLDGRWPFDGGGQDGWDAFEFSAPGRRLVMAFADTAKDAEATIPAKAAKAVIVDRHGQRSEIIAKDGAYRLTLAGATSEAGWPKADDAKAKAMGAPEHLEGGATIVLLESIAP